MELKKPYNKLKSFMALKGIKSKEVAELLGITAQTFSAKINRNGQDFTIEQVRIICNTYGLDSNDIFLE